MSDFLERLNTEREELNDKILKLTHFSNTPIYVGLSKGNKLLLSKQLNTMVEYRDILDIRLDLLKASS